MASSPSPKKARKSSGAEGGTTEGIEGEEEEAIQVHPSRVRLLQGSKGHLRRSCHGVVYWMSRDQRVQDNWALLWSQRTAIELGVPLTVVFCLAPSFMGAPFRHYHFMLEGLKEVEQECLELGIGFHLLKGFAPDVLPAFMTSSNHGCVVTDFSPLRIARQWVQDMQEKLPKDMCFYQVDAHNVVPCWEASDKLEYGARTIRRKIMERLPEYLVEFPPVEQHPHQPKGKSAERVNWTEVMDGVQADKSVGPVSWATPGTRAGLENIEDFVRSRLKLYAEKRNNPNVDALSNISPWAHFGQISVARAALTVQKARSKSSDGVAAFIEEAIVRRELSDNFCYYEENYDNIGGAKDWARESLELHKKDVREYVYTLAEFEEAKTHEDLWNAAQIQLEREGKLHGFMRMYWAKKILEWSPSPERALEIAIHLNDKYSLDGRDPNGFVGCMWSICGIHDQGWAERSVFGKIRYMNYAGCKRKFDIAQYVSKYGARAYQRSPDKNFKKK